MSLLSVCQDVIVENGFGAAPASIIGNTDALAQQCLKLANRAITSIREAHEWSALRRDSSISLEAGKASYALPFDFTDHLLADTMWDTSTKLPVSGPLTPKEWFALTNANNGVNSRLYFRLNFQFADNPDFTADDPIQLYIWPVPTTSGTLLQYQYQQSRPIFNKSFGFRSEFAADDDEVMIPKHLFSLSMNWRLRKVKGFDYAEEFNEYEKQLAISIGQDQGARTLDFSHRVSNYWLATGSLPPTIPVP